MAAKEVLVTHLAATALESPWLCNQPVWKRRGPATGNLAGPFHCTRKNIVDDLWASPQIVWIPSGTRSENFPVPTLLRTVECRAQRSSSEEKEGASVRGKRWLFLPDEAPTAESVLRLSVDTASDLVHDHYWYAAQLKSPLGMSRSVRS